MVSPFSARLRRDGRAGVRDGHERVSVVDPGRDLDMAAGGVGSDRVVDHVGAVEPSPLVSRQLAYGASRTRTGDLLGAMHRQVN
jgi:hypothetical protein